MQAVDLAAAPPDCAFPRRSRLPAVPQAGEAPEEEGEQPALSHAAPQVRRHAGRAWPTDLVTEPNDWAHTLSSKEVRHHITGGPSCGFSGVKSSAFYIHAVT